MIGSSAAVAGRAPGVAVAVLVERALSDATAPRDVSVLTAAVDVEGRALAVLDGAAWLGGSLRSAALAEHARRRAANGR